MLAPLLASLLAISSTERDGPRLADSAVQAPSVDESAWNEFLEWLSAQPANGDPRQLLAGYRVELVRRGFTPSDADRQANVLSAMVFRCPEGVRLLWDKVYAGGNRLFADRPTELLVRAVEARTPGMALDVGMGQGRNAVFLAVNGWDVTGFDPSPEGIRQARARAQQLRVTIDTAVATDDEFDFGQDKWDLIVVTYVRHLTRSDAERFWRALRPGGLVVYENGADHGNQVLAAFLNFRIVRWEDVVAVPDWGRGEKTPLQRLIAEKPLP